MLDSCRKVLTDLQVLLTPWPDQPQITKLGLFCIGKTWGALKFSPRTYFTSRLIGGNPCVGYQKDSV
jgi:hypothetical protein